MGKLTERLVDRVKADPEFFHALVFNPEEVLQNLDFLDRRARAALVAINPSDLIGRMIGDLHFRDLWGSNLQRRHLRGDLFRQ
jgi:hypothetical protein